MKKGTWRRVTTAATKVSIIRSSKYGDCQTESGAPNTCSRLSA